MAELFTDCGQIRGQCSTCTKPLQWWGHPDAIPPRMWCDDCRPKRRIDLRAAVEAGAVIEEELDGTYRRLELAGSVRRLATAVHDLDIVVAPNPGREPWSSGFIDRIRDGRRWIVLGGEAITRSSRRIRLLSARDGCFTVELYCTSLERWGYIMLLRTGPGTFGKEFVTALPAIGLRAHGGALTEADTGQALSTPEEEDVFRLAGLPFIEPKDRSPGLLKTILERRRRSAASRNASRDGIERAQAGGSSR